MAKFIINRGAPSQKTVEAEAFKLREGFFWFSDSAGSDGKTVYVYKADSLTSIERHEG